MKVLFTYLNKHETLGTNSLKSVCSLFTYHVVHFIIWYDKYDMMWLIKTTACRCFYDKSCTEPGGLTNRISPEHWHEWQKNNPHIKYVLGDIFGNVLYSLLFEGTNK